MSINLGIFLSGVLLMAFIMVISKRLNAMIRGFSAQSFFLFLITIVFAVKESSSGLYVVAALLFVIKVIVIPRLLSRMVKRIKTDETAGLIVNPALSLFVAMLLTYLSYLFTSRFLPLMQDRMQEGAFIAALAVMLIGMFIMVFRMKAIAQIIGLLVMENGLFLIASAVSGGMPFFVEIAIFFDIFICVIIMGMFVYKINKVFTHINVNKLQELKG
jgi:hydrogenase-4 component E